MSSLTSGVPTASLLKSALSKTKTVLESTCERHVRISSILSFLRVNSGDSKYESISSHIGSICGFKRETGKKAISMADFEGLCEGIKDLRLEAEPQVLVVHGWCKTVRRQDSGRLVFVIINDGSCKANLQIVVHEGAKGHDLVSKCNSGASVRATGCLVERPNIPYSTEEYESLESVSSRFELHVSKMSGHSIEVIGENTQPGKYPIAKKYITNEYLREVAHLRARSYLISATMRVRSALALATHLFFQQAGCMYLHTPLITTADCEGAGELFQVTNVFDGVKTLGELGKKMGSNLKNGLDAKLEFKKDFFKKRAFLTCSGQLSGENYACSMGSIYTFGPTFRAENSHTNRHLAEFWMIEPELSFVDLPMLMETAEAYVKFSIQYVFDHCMDDLLFFEKNVEGGLIERLKNVLETEFVRITYTDAIDILLQHQEDYRKGEVKIGESAACNECKDGSAGESASVDASSPFQYPVSWGIDLQSEHERFIAESVFKKPVIIYNYPSKIKAFYMRRNEDGKTCAAMDLIVPKIGELIGGSQREERLEYLEKSIEENGLDKKDYWWYLDLRTYGSIPHSGFGLGFERLIMMVTGASNIRDVIPFPRYVGHAEF
ncbi:asparaginyl-tRNA synthetase, putative [Theileria equi strain WA]|uniref:asparagine--tRNA ligase n=1 Tax=Theileria equi strain WA TaxID=1537102 RepID=L0AX00_THEEQ|nr:asparaginyl-tRNA synthetase, putative [Theileria equi strain WA]AFZ79783.1 asparaginyl-tRNA synthetase, putative [Theileria equi strain WA]|eukprot:XP_004829449.1 asparaginyl-tRNA synthetase, putative [Theileria equi strain WA]